MTRVETTQLEAEIRVDLATRRGLAAAERGATAAQQWLGCSGDPHGFCDRTLPGLCDPNESPITFSGGIWICEG